MSIFIQNSIYKIGGVLSPSFSHPTTKELGYTPDRFNQYGWIVVEDGAVWLSNALCGQLDELYKLILSCIQKGFTVNIPRTTINLKTFIALEQVELGEWSTCGVYVISANNYNQPQA